jgi:tRNA1Val (adenine37-N6)-methyltransferase
MKTTLDGIRDIKLYQNRDGYRFSIDALLLYSYVNVKHAKDIADLGAGSGIVGLLLAKKYIKAEVLLVELQKSLCQLAERNVRLNALEDRVGTVLADIREVKKTLSPMSFDIVVSNPPFRRPKSGRVNIEEERAVARHEIRLNLATLAESASYLLRSRGRFFMIFHPERILEVFDVLRSYSLEPKRVRFVHNDILSESKIVLVEAAKNGRPGMKIERPLYIYDFKGVYTPEVKEIYEL